MAFYRNELKKMIAADGKSLIYRILCKVELYPLD